MIVVRCDACAGRIAFDVDAGVVRCLFCASVALEPVPFDVAPELPEEVVPFAIEQAAAAQSFRAWTTASWWRPKALREVAAELVPLWLPAWHVQAEVETHWAALERARTHNGWRPRAGVDTASAATWIPASLGLSEAELTKLAPFADGTRRPFGAGDRTIAFELPALSEAGACARALPVFEAMRCRAIASREQVSQCRGSARLRGISSQLRVLPIWIGSFRYRDRAWRFVVNGHSGAVVGRAPLDRVKVTIAIVVATLVAILVAAWLERHRAPPPPPAPDQHSTQEQDSSQFCIVGRGPAGAAQLASHAPPLQFTTVPAQDAGSAPHSMSQVAKPQFSTAEPQASGPSHSSEHGWSVEHVN